MDAPLKVREQIIASLRTLFSRPLDRSDQSPLSRVFELSADEVRIQETTYVVAFCIAAIGIGAFIPAMGITFLNGLRRWELIAIGLIILFVGTGITSITFLFIRLRTKRFNNVMRPYIQELSELNHFLSQYLVDIDNRYAIHKMPSDTSLKILNYYVLTQLYHALVAAVAELEALLNQNSPAASIIALELLQGQLTLPSEVVKLGTDHLALPVYNVPLVIHTLSEELQQNLSKLPAKDTNQNV